LRLSGMLRLSGEQRVALFFPTPDSRPPTPGGYGVVALGNFDGAHLGHQAVLRRAMEEGEERGMRVIAATFDPHPRSVLKPGEAPGLLTTVEARRGLLLEFGVDEVAVIPFDRELSKKSPEEFVEEVLVGKLHANVVVVGENFRFGHKAAGDVEALRSIMRSLGGEAVGVSVRESDGDISSTRIRELLGEGLVEEASKLLGRPYSLRGEVALGDKRGRTIGFPTANVEPAREVVVPAGGVYAGFARIDGKRWAACANIGIAPTFGERESRIEAHVIDFDEDIYGKVIEVEFMRRIRGEKRFSGVEELVEQIERDVEEARRIADATI
ncbi:MAG: bifunctional riboflavin kinase/FAD synthetase, partial [Rubrobacteraceae bacterium]